MINTKERDDLFFTEIERERERDRESEKEKEKRRLTLEEGIACG